MNEEKSVDATSPSENPPAGTGAAPEAAESAVQKACRQYKERGFRHLFWRVSEADLSAGRCKGPKDRGWQRMEYGVPPDKGRYQVGLLVGARLTAGPYKGKWLSCVDVDDPSLQAVAEAALPATAMRGGKKSTPRSHLFYVTDEPCNTFKFCVPKDFTPGEPGKCAVELFGVTRRGEPGHQMAVFPSTHSKRAEFAPAADTQPYVWDRHDADGLPGLPGYTTPEALLEACKRIASACPGAVLEAGKGLPAEWQPSERDAMAKEAAELTDRQEEARAWKMGAGDVERMILQAYGSATLLESGNRQSGINRLAFVTASVLEGGSAGEEVFQRLTERLIAAAEELPPPAVNERIWIETITRAIADGRKNPRKRIGLQAYQLTDNGTADLLAVEWRDHFRYVTELKEWYAWNGNHWEFVRVEDVERSMADVFRWAVSEISAAGDAISKAFKKSALQYYLKAESSGKTSAVEGYLRSSLVSGKGLAVFASELNQDPWLFCCANGVYDIRTGKLREGRREDLITTSSPYRYVPGGRSEMFSSALDYAYGGRADAAELKAYALSWFGYCMTGSNDEQKMMVVHGNGQNGKSKTFEAIGAVAGGYGCVMAREVLLKTKTDSRNSDEVAGLCGRRFGYFSESDQMDLLAEGRVKSLTGGDEIRAMRKFQKEITFKMTCKLNLDTNHKPRIRGTDWGILRRVKLLPYDRKIEEGMRDPLWKEKLLEREGDGLLSMLLEEAHGYYLRGGLAPEPPTVRAACMEFSRENDVIGCFISDRCVTTETDTAEPSRDFMEIKDGAERVYAAYQQWCKSNGYQFPQPMGEFSKSLEARGFKSKRTRIGKFWYGLEVAPSTPES